MTIEPGAILKAGSGAEYVTGEPIGDFPEPPVAECDAESPSAYTRGDGVIHCRCLVCARCGHHTGNANQGHYWKACKVLAARLLAEHPGRQFSLAEYVRRTSRDDWHMCCTDPAFGCELEPPAAVTS